VIVSDQSQIDEDVDQLLAAFQTLQDEGASGDFSAWFDVGLIDPISNDTLYGGAGTDRFFASLNDIFKDRNKLLEIPDFMDP
jgi:hypothetical protein